MAKSIYLLVVSIIAGVTDHCYLIIISVNDRGDRSLTGLVILPREVYDGSTLDIRDDITTVLLNKIRHVLQSSSSEDGRKVVGSLFIRPSGYI